MRLSISPRNHEHINRKISSGRYGSADDVLHAALALLDEREAALDHKLHDVREQVEKATAEADAGELVPEPVTSSSIGPPTVVWRSFTCAIRAT